MPTWLIEPRDPLIVRDGRPFGLIPGVRARSLAFPFPSTTTGALRTRAGQDAQGVFQKDRVVALKRAEVRGPLLAALDDGGGVASWYAPAPADAVVLEGRGKDAVKRVPLVPLATPDGAEHNLPPGLAFVGAQRLDPSKPVARPPAFWAWPVFAGWLTAAAGDPDVGVKPGDIGVRGPEREFRTHVSINAKTQTASEGGLFQTSGLEFSTPERTRLALGVASEEPLQPGLAAVGGERRLAVWRAASEPLPVWPTGLREKIAAAGACRVVLLTPACFTAGFRPDWLLQPRDGVAPELVAVAVGRPQVVSGWDLEARRPKPTRRLVPAGSVFFLRLSAGSRDERLAWLDGVWMQNVSDAAQDRLDGFGLAAVGAWDGKLHEMEVRA